jgi:hypothetical protein
VQQHGRVVARLAGEPREALPDHLAGRVGVGHQHDALVVPPGGEQQLAQQLGVLPRDVVVRHGAEVLVDPDQQRPVVVLRAGGALGRGLGRVALLERGARVRGRRQRVGLRLGPGTAGRRALRQAGEGGQPRLEHQLRRRAVVPGARPGEPRTRLVHVHGPRGDHLLRGGVVPRVRAEPRDGQGPRGLDQVPAVQPRTGQAPGRGHTATDADHRLEGTPTHQVEAVQVDEQQRTWLVDAGAHGREQLTRPPSPRIPVVHGDLDGASVDVREARLGHHPVGADLQPGPGEVGLHPPARAPAELVAAAVDRQSGLDVVVHAPVVATLQERQHPGAVLRVVEPLQLERLVHRVVELAVDHERPLLDGEPEGPQQVRRGGGRRRLGRRRSRCAPPGITSPPTGHAAR